MEDIHATKIVRDLETPLVEYVRQHLKEKIAKGAKPVLTYRTGQVYSFGDAENGYIVLTEGDSVEYFVRLRRVSHNGFRLGRQVLLWRNRESRSRISGGFAQFAFFNILLPKYTALIADKEQTKHGAAFWDNAITAAFARGLHVYFLDRRSRKTQLIELFDDKDLAKYSQVLWGDKPQHLLTFAVISTKPLSLTRGK